MLQEDHPSWYRTFPTRVPQNVQNRVQDTVLARAARMTGHVTGGTGYGGRVQGTSRRWGTSSNALENRNAASQARVMMMMLAASWRRRKLSFCPANSEHCGRPHCAYTGCSQVSLVSSASRSYGSRAKAASRLRPHPLVGRKCEARHKHVEPGTRRRRAAPRRGVRAAPLAAAVPATTVPASVATPASACE